MTPADLAMLRTEAAYYRRQERTLTALGKHGEARRNRNEAAVVEARIAAAEAIDTADIVRHGPTGEEWVVACVRGDRLSWCGWPEGMANLADCTLVRKATTDQREKLLRDLAAIEGGDHRARYARARLAEVQRVEAQAS